ncbi:MAG TPA: hypothetical protein VK843_03990 [Planctomycetota bacterium]|nr:hypothetical protein [Planctomycetota bacterium]
MSRAWLDNIDAQTGTPGARSELKPGLTMLGGARGDLPVPASGSDCVHLWSEPPKLIFVGGGEPPRVNGQDALELSLHSGDRIDWRGQAWRFGYEDGQARLEEVAPSAPAEAPKGGPNPSTFVAATGGELAWKRLKAGLVAELSISDKAVIKRWQDAVVRNEFDAEAATRDLLAGAPDVADGDNRLLDRSTRLMRDLLMSSVTRGAGRQVRKAARNTLAFLLVQGFILILFILLVLAGLLLVHTKFGHSIDAFLDSVVNFF